MLNKRRFIPDPTGQVCFEAPNGVVDVPEDSNHPTESNLDDFAGPWSANTWEEQFGNGAATLGLGSNPANRKLVGKMKNGG